jgi:hypothetical protein
MKSEKIVKVIIKDGRLRKIRKNLRDLLKCAVEERLKQLLKEIRENREKGNHKLKLLKIMEHSNLLTAFDDSTIMCGYERIGGPNRGYYGCISQQKADDQGEDVEKIKTDLDLVWVPIYKSWFCTECVKEFDMESLTIEDFPDMIAQMKSKFRK